MLGRRLGFSVRLPVVAITAMLLAGCQSMGGFSGGGGTILPQSTNTAVGSDVNIQSLTDVVNRNPSDPSSYNVRGIAYAEAGRPRDAINDFTRAVELDGSFYQAYANRALVYADQSRFEEALADYNRALQVNPNYSTAYGGRGNVYRLMGQSALALSDFDQAIAIDPADARTFYDRGLLYQSQGQLELALADFTSAISFSPRAGEAYAARGEIYIARGNWDAAFEDYFQAISLGDSNAKNWTNLGIALENEDDLPTANIAFNNALQIDPNYQPAIQGAARTAAFAAQQTAGAL